MNYCITSCRRACTHAFCSHLHQFLRRMLMLFCCEAPHKQTKRPFLSNLNFHFCFPFMSFWCDTTIFAMVVSHFRNKFSCDLLKTVVSSLLWRKNAALHHFSCYLPQILQVSLCLFLLLPTAATNVHTVSPHNGSVGICVLGKCLQSRAAVGFIALHKYACGQLLNLGEIMPRSI